MKRARAARMLSRAAATRLLVSSVISLSLSCAPSAPEPEVTGLPVGPSVVGGEHDVVDASVVMLLIQDSIGNPTKQSACTGSVVSPHVVLTAAHCLDGASNGVGDPSYVALFLGDDVNDAQQGSDPKLFAFEKEHHFDPAFDPAHYLDQEHDFAVVITESPLAPPPLALNRGAAPAVGTTVHLAGYGLTDPTQLDGFGAREMTDAAIAGESDTHFYFVDSGLCIGDSGGAGIVVQDGKPTVVGVTSYGEHKSTCLGKVYDTKVDAALLAYVDPFIEANDPGFLPPAGAGGAGGADVSAGVGGSSGGGPAPKNDEPADRRAESSGGCATRGGRGPGAAWLGGFLVAWALARRRRIRG